MELFRPLKASEKGQISIFFSTTVVVMVTLIAFIINIGIFVKAKINLQNATDAAAYAGASVQARQLTNIAYMNWEMRNVFKEWMFKYYVLGGLNLPDVFGAPSGSFMSYTMQSYDRTSTTAEDLYNFPSVCIDFAETGGVGMCTRYLVPGLPRFESSNVLGMDETTNAFIDTIVAEKSQDCSRRSQLNFFTANTWAYNVQTNDGSVSNITAQAPQMASNFMGAFPKAFEIGLRIRALEAEVNFAPVVILCDALYNSLLCLIRVPYSYVVFDVQVLTLADDLILSNLIVVSKSLTRSLFRTAYAFAGLAGAVPSSFPPDKIISGVVVYPVPSVTKVILLTLP